jgi:hypothetical protein
MIAITNASLGGGSETIPRSINTNTTFTTNTATTGITVSTTNTSAGSSGTNANYQPYITVYIWKRTA